MEYSILSYIKEHIKEGTLPDDFSLPKIEDENQLTFEDGAMDGIRIYHMSGSEIDKEKLVQILTLINEEAVNEATALLYDYCKTNTALNTIDEMQQYIIEHEEELEAGKFFEFAVEQVFEGTMPEVIKVGLSILELFDIEDENLKNIIRELGLSNEFTLFVLFLMRKWENASEEIFELAKKVKGWGRIHAIEQLEVTTEEMEVWLLTEGIHNTIIPEYSALTCYEKSNMQKRLKQTMSYQEYHGAGQIIESLLNESKGPGPVVGFSAVENPVELLHTFLEKSEEYSLAAEDYQIILTILDYVMQRKEKEYMEIAQKCQSILSSKECIMTVKKAVKEGEYFELAKNLGLEYKEEVMNKIKSDLRKNYYHLNVLISEEQYVDELIALYEEQLPLDKMGTGADNKMGLGEEYKDYQVLIYLVQFLNRYVGKGIRLIKTALNSPVINNRNLAIKTLNDWTELENKNIKEISEEIYQELLRVKELEVLEDVKEKIVQLIEQEK